MSRGVEQNEAARCEKAAAAQRRPWRHVPAAHVLALVLPMAVSGAYAAGARAQAAASAQEPGQEMERYTEQIEGSTVTFEMVPVPAGEGPAGEDGSGEGLGPFWIGRTEVPWELYDVYVFGLDEGGVQTAKGADAVSRPSKPYVLPGEDFGHDGHPALAMTHHGAEQFAAWLSEKTGRTYRLPTEAEWEYICEAGREGQEAPLDSVAWHGGNASDRTHVVASLRPNRFGAHDLLGNVAEWVTVPGEEPVIKGGSFQTSADEVACAARRAQTPAWNATDPQLPKSSWWLPDAPFLGVRLVREPEGGGGQ